MSQMGLRPSVGNFSDTPSDRMSLVGQSRHFDRPPVTSALPREADILRVIRHVAEVPAADALGGGKQLTNQLIRQRAKEANAGD